MSSLLRHQTTTLIQERKRIFRELLFQGLASLSRAQADPGQEQALLKEACNYLMEAMRYDRSAPEGFTAMAWLLWLTGDSAAALPYLQEALLLAPAHRDALMLMQRIQPGSVSRPGTGPLMRPVGSSAAVSRPPRFARPLTATAAPPIQESIDYDRLYDQLEAQIQKEVKQISLLNPNWYQSSRLRSSVQKTEQHYANLRTKYRSFLQQIRALEVELDATDLRRMLKPLEIILNRCEYHLQLSWQMIQLEEMLEGHFRWVSHALHRLERQQKLPPDFSAQRFDYLLDDCDALADQLDELEQMSIESAHLVKAYESLASKVSRFQDLRQQYEEVSPA